MKFVGLMLWSTLLFVLVVPTTWASPAYQADGPVCTEEYVVQADDWLSKVAERYLGDVSLYTDIVATTNQKRAEDESFAQIDNPDLIEPGWKLCIVETDAMAAEKSMDSTEVMTDSMETDTMSDETADSMNLTEVTVTLENEITGIVARPNGVENRPAVLLLHGFASQKDEVGDMYKDLAAALADAGIASLRVDFRGWGDSDSDMADSTIQGQVEDAKVAYDYLSAQEFVDSDNVGETLN